MPAVAATTIENRRIQRSYKKDFQLFYYQGENKNSI
jgi:hypothetical protein